MIHKRTTLAAILFAGLLAVAQLFAQSSGPKTLTGVVSDCYVRRSSHGQGQDSSRMHADLHKQGMKYALVAGDKVIRWKGTTLNSTNVPDKRSR